MDTDNRVVIVRKREVEMVEVIGGISGDGKNKIKKKN